MNQKQTITMTSEPVVKRKRGLIPEDLMRFRWIDDIALAPDAATVAYTIRQPDVDTNGYLTHLYVRSLDTGTTRRITTGVGQATSITWNHDSNKVAFAFTGEDGPSVQVWDAETDDTHIYPMPDAAMTGLDWSPDGTKLAGVRWTPMPHAEDRGPAPGIPAPTIKVIRRLRYKRDGVGWVEDRYTQIWVLELETGDCVQITHSECDFSAPKWSGGDKLAFVGMAREQNVSLGYGQIFVCDFPGGTPRLLLPNWQGTAVSPVWGDDDKHIAFAGHNYPPPVNRRNFWQPHLADVETGTAIKLGEDIDEEVGNYAVADQRAGLANVTVKWAPGDDYIYFLLTERGATNLYRIDTSGNYECLVSGESVTFEYSPAVGGVVAYGQGDPTNPGELYLWQEGTDENQKLTNLNPWLRDITLAAPESYTYKGVDDADVHGWLIKPLDYEPGKQYPAIVYVHCSMFSWDFNHEFQVYANAGYVVAYFNQRGTTAGYGQDWTHASMGDQGGKDYEEIMLGVDDLVARGFVDETRMGVTGGSCGGFMTNWIVGHTDRFAAAVTQRSISNEVSHFGTADIGPECTEGETGTNPWKDLQALWQQSPIAYVADVTTPLLIIHSDEDYRCPLEQAEQLFAALRWMGKTVEMVIFEGESHGLSRGGRLGNRIERQRRILGWFLKYLNTYSVMASVIVEEE